MLTSEFLSVQYVLDMIAFFSIYQIKTHFRDIPYFFKASPLILHTSAAILLPSPFITSTDLECIFDLRCSNKTILHDIRSGERGGQATGPSVCIKLVEHSMFNYSLTRL